VQASTEALSPTRVKLTVEVPFAELTPSLDRAYKKLAQQVRVQGFRPGKVPPRILDQRLGRGAVLSEALDDALPRFYSDAVEQTSIVPVSRPEVDVTGFGDNEPLVFTAEVDVRPEVDEVAQGQEEIDQQLSLLRDRFAVLRSVDRPVADGDYLSIDLSATVDGTPVPEADTSGLSYEVGHELRSHGHEMVVGLDEALIGLSEGESRTFTTRLVAGEFADRDAEVTVTVKSVKEKDLPALDDDFAQTASEFETLAELETSIRDRVRRVKLMEQGIEARDKTLDALLDLVEIPLPQSMVDAEAEFRTTQLDEQLSNAGLNRENYLESEGKTEDELTTEVREGAEKSVKAQFVLDAIADAEELGVAEAELTQQLFSRAARLGISPDQYAQQLVQNGQLPLLVAEVRRGKALALVLESAVITDAAGNTVDLEALREDVPVELGGDAGDAGDADAESPAEAEAADEAATPEADEAQAAGDAPAQS
jgi:trigger factor